MQAKLSDESIHESLNVEQDRYPSKAKAGEFPEGAQTPKCGKVISVPKTYNLMSKCNTNSWGPAIETHHSLLPNGF
ncbi:hypothetical protein PIB30_055829 [Stylosanthes scabra]|uniref:Uncharacterized protein n=1 Tax=Stylosanthes scabra TaxID=79078 RepID=A0ABU6XKS9_9FABA|nr:hypothetical protein [Stylosanthes scabra]